MWNNPRIIHNENKSDLISEKKKKFQEKLYSIDRIHMN